MFFFRLDPKWWGLNLVTRQVLKPFFKLKNIQVIEEMSIQTNVPAIAMEEVTLLFSFNCFCLFDWDESTIVLSSFFNVYYVCRLRQWQCQMQQCLLQRKYFRGQAKYRKSQSLHRKRERGGELRRRESWKVKELNF